MSTKETNYVGQGKTFTFDWGTKESLNLNFEKIKQLPVDKYGNIKVDVVKRRSPDKFGNDLSVVENTYVPKTGTQTNAEDDLTF
jgi:hypothetical protein